ncbi:hypothetical protein GCM10023351_29950 [Microbacterium gilvum]|uniref:Cutinase n=1 Tax=Microbacterium gilvum TaxID=1336204 RepID=A0ABP9AKB5_9MICO
MVFLGGYSQGADVIARALPKLTSSARSLIKGVVLFGDPGYLPNRAINAPGLNPANHGYFPWSTTAANLLDNLKTQGWNADTNKSGWRQTVRSYCRKGDAVCQNVVVSGWDIHENYTAYIAPAHAYLRNFLLQG